MLDLDNMTAIDIVLNGQAISLTEVEVIKGGVTTTVWRAHTHTSECYHYHTDSCYAGDNYAECPNCGRTEGDWAIGEECTCGGTFNEAYNRWLICNIPEGTKICGYE